MSLKCHANTLQFTLQLRIKEREVRDHMFTSIKNRVFCSDEEENYRNCFTSNQKGNYISNIRQEKKVNKLNSWKISQDEIFIFLFSMVSYM